nr:hypothetical protein GCM10010200_059630 [Actinomadura rugatobispora]
MVTAPAPGELADEAARHTSVPNPLEAPVYGPPPGPSPAPPAAPPPSTPAAAPRPTAQQIVARLETLYPLPEPRDNTHSCAPACRGLITTDAVSVYDWREETSAKRWATSAGKNAERVGLTSCRSPGAEQAMTSQEARDKMAAEVKRMLSAP